jgi:hypothetical protein
LMLGNTGYRAEAERQLVSSFLAWFPGSDGPPRAPSRG